jgi:hypothetical protein
MLPLPVTSFHQAFPQNELRIYLHNHTNMVNNKACTTSYNFLKQYDAKTDTARRKVLFVNKHVRDYKTDNHKADSCLN